MATYRIALVRNIHAGLHDEISRMLAQNAEPALREAAGDPKNVVSFRTHSLEELDRVADEIIRDGFDYVFIVGGDGTIHRVLTALTSAARRRDATRFPSIGAVPAGTMNVAAQTLGLCPQGREAYLNDIVKRFRTEEIARVRATTLSVNGRIGFLYGAGLPVRALERYAESGGKGMMTAAKTALGIFAEEVLSSAGLSRFKRSVADPFEVGITGKDEDGDFLASSRGRTTILAGTIESIGIGMNPLYRARERQDRFHLIACDHDFWGYAKRGSAMIHGTPLGGLDRVADAATLTYSQPMKRFIDGDIYKADEISEHNTDRLACGPEVYFLRA